MNINLANDLLKYAELVEDGELICPEEMNCAALMRLAAEALVKQEQGRPVAWATFSLDGVNYQDSYSEGAEPLYEAPRQQVWVGLTDEEISKLQHLIDWTAHWSYGTFARAIEAKLKEKNT